MTRPLGEQTPEQLERTRKSKELTDKVHRLIRRFSRELVVLVSEEIGARAPKVKNKPGPKKGFKVEPQECPLCLKNKNPWRKRAYVCLECKPKSWKYRKNPKKDRLGAGFKVEVRIPEHLPVKPKEVEVPDAEPDFLDSLAVVVPTVIDRPASKPKATTEDEDFFQ